ncbi:hypothetical protein B9G55_12585 [Saccharibacillus sp. O16]|nr:hypothetical protein B9G55_12585 [Saccharibacillus sp. O16]
MGSSRFKDQLLASASRPCYNHSIKGTYIRIVKTRQFRYPLPERSFPNMPTSRLVTFNDRSPHARSPFFDSSEPALGVLNPREGSRHFRLLRYSPAPELSPYVRHYWSVEWDLTDSDPYLQEVVPNPCVNLVIEPGRTFFYPPSPARFAYLQQGRGQVFGVKFHPGGFYPFLQASLSEQKGRPVSVESVLPITGAELEKLLLTSGSQGPITMIEQIEHLLIQSLPLLDEETVLLRQITERIAADRDLTRVDEVCRLFHIEKRTLQRLFSRRVGLSPKWTIRLHRLQEAAEALDRGASDGFLPGLQHLSSELGYHDQTHFTKDFKAIVGVTPEAYAQGIRG